VSNFSKLDAFALGDGPIPLRIIPVPPVVDFDRFATNAEEFPL
jgi:hypothetical protein